ncbi:MAG TPA: DotU family type IV/VI secretion system protein [Terriglobia bacterium]|jgi:type VI secretion system protein ImpK
MSAVEESTSLLLLQFRDFYGEMIKLKRLIKSGTPLDAGGAPEQTPGERAAIAVADRVIAVMEQEALVAGRRGADYTGIYTQAQYVMAALADEILLHQLEWIGKEAWNTHLIEYRLFRTRVAGEEFFNRLDRLLQTPDPMYKDLATIYLLAIMLGFRGKYWANNDRGRIDYYRRQLFTFIFHGQPELHKDTKKLFPEAYLHTVEEGAGRKVPQVKLWFILLAVMVVVYFFISRSIWVNSTAELDRITTRIEALSR